MRQVMQDCRSGEVYVDDVPAPQLHEEGVIVRTRNSVLSVGTERSMLEFASQSLMGKARSRPDLVKQVIRKAKNEGIGSAYKAAMSRLNVPLPLGYSSAGDIIDIGSKVTHFCVGDRVACAGAGYASHAEVVYVPLNLVARIPDGVAYEEAAFATIGAIAMQGVRIADLRLGEKVVILGLGLLGLLTVQIAKAAGCMVLGADTNVERVTKASEIGADSAVVASPEKLKRAVMAFTAERGADAVIITAATESNEPTVIAGEISRLKGRVVAVGDVGMNIPRRVYYPKELDYRISRSYGPGRYDPRYEEKGIDYPYEYVPFTEQRNMEGFLQLTSGGKVTPSRLITHRFELANAVHAYRVIREESGKKCLGVVFSYPGSISHSRKIQLVSASPSRVDDVIHLSVIGAGNYARDMLLPHFAREKELELLGVCTSTSISGKHTAKRFGFRYCSTSPEEVISDPDADAILIATRHNHHARYVEQALRSGKHVFVEKPLAIDRNDAIRLVEMAREFRKILMVGFNRRFSAFGLEAKSLFADCRSPLSMVYRVNAGHLPAQHWTKDPEVGGGRILGEVCHFVDFLQFLCASEPKTVYAVRAISNDGHEDSVIASISYADGSIGTIAYISSGDEAIPKEHVEVFGGGAVAVIDDFRRAHFAHEGKIRKLVRWGQDKGQRSEVDAFIRAVRGRDPEPISLHQVLWTSLCTFCIEDSIRLGYPVSVA